MAVGAAVWAVSVASVCPCPLTVEPVACPGPACNGGQKGPNAGPGACGPGAAAGAGLWDSGSPLPGLAAALATATAAPCLLVPRLAQPSPRHLSAGLLPGGVGPQAHGHSQPDIEGPLP